MTETLKPFVPVLAIRRTRRGIAIHNIHPDGVDHVGTFENVADAWKAVDALDLATSR
jgi:hypothetical protein